MGLLKLLLLPPGPMFVAIAAGWLLRGRPFGRQLMAFGVIALYIASTPLVGGSLVSLTEGLARPDDAGVPTAIVVLGGTFDRGDTPDVGALTLQRMRSGLAAHRDTGLPVLVTSGPIAPDRQAGGEIMAHVYEHDLGLEVTWVEPTAGNTWQNATASAAILLPEGHDTILLVTNRWHLPRAARAFDAVGFRVQGYAAEPPNEVFVGLASLLPTASGLAGTYFALHELAGIVWYEIYYPEHVTIDKERSR